MAGDLNGAVPGCVAEEISYLKKHHEGKCKIIESVGDFAYIITIQLQINNLSLKFQLTSKDNKNFCKKKSL